MMPEQPEPAAMRADAEALDWLVALLERPDDPALRSRLDRWRAADPLNEAAWREAASLYADIGETRPIHSGRWKKLPPRPALILERGFDRTFVPSRWTTRVRRFASPREGWTSRMTPRIALAAAAAVLIVLARAPDLALRLKADVMAGTGELREITLADGSHASLAPGSALSFDYSGPDRRVTLLRGKAWFAVRHDDTRPFRVDAGWIRTIDIGTAFEVDMSDRAVGIAVGEGSVRVETAANVRTLAERLSAGQSLSVDAGGRTQQQSQAPEMIGAWRDGQLAVQDRPMREVVEALRPWYRGVIVVPSDALADRRVTGVYDLRDPAGAMQALTKAYGGHLTQITPWLMVLSGS